MEFGKSPSQKPVTAISFLEHLVIFRQNRNRLRTLKLPVDLQHCMVWYRPSGVHSGTQNSLQLIFCSSKTAFLSEWQSFPVRKLNARFMICPQRIRDYLSLRLSSSETLHCVGSTRLPAFWRNLEILVTMYQITWHHIQGYHSFNIHYFENLIPHEISFMTLYRMIPRTEARS